MRKTESKTTCIKCGAKESVIIINTEKKEHNEIFIKPCIECKEQTFLKELMDYLNQFQK